ncbi:MAG: hypothetical protein ABW168_27035 [Sedimenticola sp.]
MTRGAMAHAEIDANAVDGIFVGVMNNGFSRQSLEGSLVVLANQELSHVPAVHVKKACASGSAALYAALDYLGVGRGEIVRS